MAKAANINDAPAMTAEDKAELKRKLNAISAAAQLGALEDEFNRFLENIGVDNNVDFDRARVKIQEAIMWTIKGLSGSGKRVRD
jgi:hypothetical protein